jgi:magnesium-transporting ATPase (P-type)
VTGDGTNDGPALKAADVGLLHWALAELMLPKKRLTLLSWYDKFSSIVKYVLLKFLFYLRDNYITDVCSRTFSLFRAVLRGRSVFDNIRKFLQFQLTVNVVALTITFLSAVAGYQPPLNAIMMLWVNLIMDTMGAFALAAGPPRIEIAR